MNNDEELQEHSWKFRFRKTFKKSRKYITFAVIMSIVGFLFSPQILSLQHTGILGLTDFKHEDFGIYFKNHYNVNEKHTYLDYDGLKIWVKNNYFQQNSVRTILKVPNFVKAECTVQEPTIESDRCDRYIIPAGTVKQLVFNITIEENPSKQEHKFCLITERLSNWWLFDNKKEDCIDVTIN